MYFYTSLCSVVLFLFVHCEKLSLPETNQTDKNLTSIALHVDLPTKTNMTLVSEGGTLLSSTLPKQKLNSLITLDEELSKNKEKAVVPRKGVNNMLADTSTSENNSSESESTKTVIVSDRLNTTRTLLPTIKSADVNVMPVMSNSSSATSKVNSTIEHKKPQILSYEALVNWDKQVQNNQPKIQISPSTQTASSSQISSPNKDSIAKVYPTKASSSHPGMIMPIVITILVVPMFAIVGYMALKRGQEAWKNRHYKRMDFLLDGMYND